MLEITIPPTTETTRQHAPFAKPCAWITGKRCRIESDPPHAELWGKLELVSSIGRAILPEVVGRIWDGDGWHSDWRGHSSLEPLPINLLIHHRPPLLLPYHQQQAAIQLRLSPRTLISSRNGRPPSVVDEDTPVAFSSPSSSKHSTPCCQHAPSSGRWQDCRAQTTRHHLTPPGRHSELAHRDPHLPRAGLPAH